MWLMKSTKSAVAELYAGIGQRTGRFATVPVWWDIFPMVIFEPYADRTGLWTVI